MYIRTFKALCFVVAIHLKYTKKICRVKYFFFFVAKLPLSLTKAIKTKFYERKTAVVATAATTKANVIVSTTIFLYNNSCSYSSYIWYINILVIVIFVVVTHYYYFTLLVLYCK